MTNEFRDNRPVGWHLRADGSGAILYDFNGRPVCNERGEMFNLNVSDVLKRVTAPARWPKQPRWWKTV